MSKTTLSRRQQSANKLAIHHELARMRPRLLRRAWSLTGSRADAEDLTQDTLLRALRKPSWPATPSMQRYALGIMQHVHQDRRARVRRGHSLRQELGFRSMVQLPGTSEARALQAIIDAWTVDECALVEIVAVEGNTIRAASRVLGVPYITARRRMAYVRWTLRHVAAEGGAR